MKQNAVCDINGIVEEEEFNFVRWQKNSERWEINVINH